VTFGVDAYPAEDFVGNVTQVRLEPIVEQNVVTYATVIDVPNPELKLKPGMTANVSVEIARRDNAMRVPNAALRFRPTDAVFAALGQTPPGAEAPDGRAAGGPRPADGPAPAAAGDAGGPDLAPPPGGGGGGRGGGGRGNFADRLQNMSPDEREQALERMRARGFDPTALGGGPGTGNGGGRRQAGNAQPAEPITARNPAATTIDALFGPLAPVESTGRVWRYVDGQLRPVRVRLGITDGQATELLEGDIQPGTELVTNVTIGGEVQAPQQQGGIANPFSQQQGGRGGFRGRGF
jgi:HlyD family secretion protein